MTKGKHKKLKSLKCFREVETKIKANIALEVIAEWIQEEMLEYTDVSRDGVVKALQRYKRDLPPAEIVREPPLYLKKTIEKIRRGVREWEELEGLYLLQLKRISIDVQTEEKINKLFSGTNREIELASKMLRDLVEVKEKLGMVESKPKSINVNHSGGVMTANADVDMSGISEEQKSKLGMLSERLITGILTGGLNEEEEKQEDE